MPESDIPDSKQRLEKALSGISTSQMKAVRAEVQSELQSLANTPIPPLRTGHIPPPPAELVENAKAMAGEKTAVRDSDIEDLQRAGKIAADFMTGMDRISDVLMLLVLKFGRASTLMVVVVAAIIIGVVFLAGNLFLVWNISVSQTALQREQEKIQEQQKATQLVAGQAKQQAEAAAQTASAIQQNAPEVVIDSKGKPQLILRVQKPGEGEHTVKVAPPPQSRIKDSKSAGQTLEVPLK